MRYLRWSLFLLAMIPIPNNTIDRFHADGYVISRNLLDLSVRSFLHQYGLKSARDGRLKTDKRVPGTPACYGDPLMEALLEIVCPRIEAATGRSLCPTYSYYRVYRKGDVLHRHVDREACEVSVTVSLGSDGLWPLWIEADSRPTEVLLHPGDGLIYQGMRIAHWRDAFGGDAAVQVFLHYVDRAGTRTEWAFDKRGRLATSHAARLVVQRLIASDAVIRSGG